MVISGLQAELETARQLLAVSVVSAQSTLCTLWHTDIASSIDELSNSY